MVLIWWSWSVSDVIVFLFQWCLLWTRPGVSTALPAPPATPSSPSSKWSLNKRHTATISHVTVEWCVCVTSTRPGLTCNTKPFLIFSPSSFNRVSSHLFVLLYTSPCAPCPLSNLLSLPSHPSVFFPPWCSLLFLSTCPSSSSPPLFHTSHLSPIPPCSVRDKFVEVDLKPVCKHCYERLPVDMKRRFAKRERASKDKKKKNLIPMCLWSSLSPFFSFPLFFLWSVSIFLPLCFFLVSYSSYFKQAACK